MALSITNQAAAFTTKLLLETDVQASTPVIDATGTSGVLYTIHADNAVSGTIYLQIYDGTDLTVGTTAPTMTFPLTADGELSITFPGGWAFSSLTFWASTSEAQANTADPGSAVKLAIVTS